MAIDEKNLQNLIGKMLGDVGAAMGTALVLLGDKFGLYKTLAGEGPLTAAELASRTGTAERYVREWAAAQAAAGYINYDSASTRFSMSPEQALVLADEGGPAFFPGIYEIAAAAIRDEPKVAEAFRPGYAMHLVSEWIPALEGVEEKLKRGARVADVGCGHGASVILLAQAYPKSEFVGFD